MECFNSLYVYIETVSCFSYCLSSWEWWQKKNLSWFVTNFSLIVKTFSVRNHATVCIMVIYRESLVCLKKSIGFSRKCHDSAVLERFSFECRKLIGFASGSCNYFEFDWFTGLFVSFMIGSVITLVLVLRNSIENYSNS